MLRLLVPDFLLLHIGRLLLRSLRCPRVLSSLPPLRLLLRFLFLVCLFLGLPLCLEPFVLRRLLLRLALLVLLLQVHAHLAVLAVEWLVVVFRNLLLKEKKRMVRIDEVAKGSIE